MEVQKGNKQTFRFPYGEGYVKWSNDFYSGNLASVVQLSPESYEVTGYPDVPKAIKSCLYFSVEGFPMGTRIRITARKMAILQYFYAAEQAMKDKRSDTSYQFCYRNGYGYWQRSLEASILETGRQYTYGDKYLLLTFSHTFWTNDRVYFCFNYPYTYLRHYVFFNHVLYQHLENSYGIYYSDEVLAVSRRGRPIRIVTITSESGRAFSQKSVILVTARVHPSESPSSYVAYGIISFLVNKYDLRSKRLRDSFVFMIVPMLNPDGVAMGNFRYDDLGQNLNRYYQEPNEEYQPSIFAVRNLMDELSSRLLFYFDLHAHHSPKGCFIYGNFLYDFVRQVEAKAFCRTMSINNVDFEYQNCNFAQNQMVAKDKQDIKTKEGCGRVVAHRIANIVHSYTVYCGYYRGNQPNYPTKYSNTDYKYGPYHLTTSDNKYCYRIYRTHNYREIGRDLMISVLDIIGLNPYSRIAKSEYRDVYTLRRMIASYVFYSEQRFRRTDNNLLQKLKNINSMVSTLYANIKKESQLYDKRMRMMRIQSQTVRGSKDVQNIPKLEECQYVAYNIMYNHLTINPVDRYAFKEDFLSKHFNSSVEVQNNVTLEKPLRTNSTSCNNQGRREVSPTKRPANCKKSDITLNIGSDRISSYFRTTKTNKFRMSTRKITRTDPSYEVQRRLETKQPYPLNSVPTTMYQHKKSINMYFRVVIPDSHRRDILMGRYNSIIKCYYNARRRAAAHNQPNDDPIVFKLPKLENLIEVKARIIQYCRLYYILKPPQGRK